MTEDIVDTPLPAEPRTEAAFVPCPVCDGRMRVTLVDDWQETGIAIPIVDCGNPWHYTNVERGAAAPEPRQDLREALEREQFYAGNLSAALLKMGHHPFGKHQSPLDYDSESNLACDYPQCLAALATTPPAPEKER